MHKNCNYLENVSLTVLVFISVMNLLKAVYFEAGNIPDGTPDRLFMNYDWVEGVLVGVLPLLAVLLVGVVIGLRIIVFLFSCGMKLCTKYSKWWHVALTWLNVIKCSNGTVKKVMTRQTLCRIFQNFVYYHSVLAWCFPVDIASRVDDAAWWCGISGVVRLKWYKHKFVNPLRCRYNAVNLLQNLHNRHPIARLWGHWWRKEPGPWFNIKMSPYQYRKSHCGDKTVVRSSYLHNGISYTGKMTSLYWIGIQDISRNAMTYFLWRMFQSAHQKGLN